MSTSSEGVDESIVGRAADGDRDAQRMIYEAYVGRVYRTVQRIVGENDAADVTQDTFLHLFDKLASYRREAAFTTWLHRLVVNEALQHLRRRGRRLAKMQPLPQQPVADRPSSGADEVREILTEALERIEPDLRLILQLKEMDELSYGQIGEIVGIPAGTVGSRLNRARREMRAQLLQLGWDY